MVVAWRIHHLAKLGREVPDLPCTVFFGDAEWKALVAYKTNNPLPPPTVPSLKEAVRMVASLGGFLGRKADGDPGVKSLWIGLQRFDDLTAIWRITMSAWVHPRGDPLYPVINVSKDKLWERGLWGEVSDVKDIYLTTKGCSRLSAGPSIIMIHL